MADLPTLDFTYGPPFERKAGLRPFREDGFRLEWSKPASAPGKLLVHNYGHGGAGISLSWGCADQVLAMVKAHRPTGAGASIAVLGSGVMGLTAATRLVELGLPVTIYTEKTWDKSTSAVAGGEWAPSVVNYGSAQQFVDVLRTSYQTFKASIGKGYGVSELPYYTPRRYKSLDLVLDMVPGLLPARQRLQRLPFKNHTAGGYLYKTLLVEPPVFLPRLAADLAGKVPVVLGKIKDAGEALALPHNIIVNCTGLGSKSLWPDPSLRAIKGQLAILPPQPALKYLYSQSGYLFPRVDGVVIGGTFEETFANPDADPAVCRGLVAHMAALFGEGAFAEMAEHHIDHPRNVPRIAARQVPTG